LEKLRKKSINTRDSLGKHRNNVNRSFYVQDRFSQFNEGKSLIVFIKAEKLLSKPK
jgi:hypothetical protein